MGYMLWNEIIYYLLLYTHACHIIKVIEHGHMKGTMPSQILFRAQQTLTVESNKTVPLFFLEANSFGSTAVADKI